MRRTKEDSEKTRTAILLAAEELFLEKGVSHTSLEQIARAAGVTRGAVYWHFQNKAHLFNEMLNQVRLPPEQLTERLSGCDGSDPLRSLYDLCLEAVQSLLTQEKKRRILTILMQRCEFTEELREAGDPQPAHCPWCGRALPGAGGGWVLRGSDLPWGIRHDSGHEGGVSAPGARGLPGGP